MPRAGRLVLLVLLVLLAGPWLPARVCTAQFAAAPRINLNTATLEELMHLPGIGEGFAARIVEHRRKHGPFKRPQDVIIVRGMSARRYRAIAHRVGI
jgi:competence ComEA-like helix-hairpin-helix protein